MRGTAGQFWAETAESYFGGMTSQYEPGERAPGDAPKVARRVLPPLTVSEDIIAAIAACAPRASSSGKPVMPSPLKKPVEVG